MRTSLLALVLLCGCPEPTGQPDAALPLPPRDAGPTPDAGDPVAELFAPDHLVDVRIEMAAADWDLLRNQTRDLFTLLAGDCTSRPFPSPFTTFPATVTVDGTRLPQSTIKKKGFLGSLSANRPSLKLKFDEYVDQLVSGVDTLTLNNAQQDPSVVRQCLGYQLFRKAGLHAPRCNFAHVFVNGVDLGVYANVEGIDKDFLRRRFAKAGGNLYEGTLSDFNATYAGTFDLKDDKTDRTDLMAVLTALSAPDAELLSRLSTVMDVDQFIDFWAMETLVRHADGYNGNTNNFFIYDDPSTGKFVFIPWGADAIFFLGQPGPDTPDGPMLRSELARRLYALPDVKARYLARVRSYLDTVFSEAELRADVARFDALIAPHLHPIQQSQFDGGMTDVRSFIANRRSSLTPQLVSPPAASPPVRSSPCLKPIGTFTSQFQTTWGTIETDNPFQVGSTATFTLALDAGVIPFGFTAATAGIDPGGNDGPKPGINLVGANLDGGFTAALLRFQPGLYPQPLNVALPFDLFGRVGFVLRYSGGVIEPVGLFGNGTLTLTSSANTDAGVVAGSITTDVFTWPFGPGGM